MAFIKIILPINQYVICLIKLINNPQYSLSATIHIEPASFFWSHIIRLLDMPEDELAGCGDCVRVIGPGFGASERLVVSTVPLEERILQIPGGQSVHPLSPYSAISTAIGSIELLARKPKHKLILKPDAD